jgi:hypothetical protein
MGKLIRARDYAASSLALQERVSNVWAIAHTLSGLADDLREGRPEAAMARLESLLQRSGWDDKDVVPLLPRPGRSISGLRGGGYGRDGAARGRQASQGAI